MTIHRTPSPTLAATIALALLLFLVPACSLPGRGGEEMASGPVDDHLVGQVTTDDGVGTLQTAPWGDGSARAIVTGDGSLTVFDGPDGNPAVTLNPRTPFGTPRVLLVEEEADGWAKVRLPMRPNHQVGWVPTDRVELEDLDVEVRIDLATRSLVVRDGADVLLTSPVAIGTTANPTPTGTFFITDKLETPDPAGAYGPFALGLSGYSEVLTEFAGGDGQIGIHGTDDPASIGQDVSHGCIRVPNDIVSELAALLPLGTPVHIA